MLSVRVFEYIKFSPQTLSRFTGILIRQKSTLFTRKMPGLAILTKNDPRITTMSKEKLPFCLKNHLMTWNMLCYTYPLSYFCNIISQQCFIMFTIYCQWLFRLITLILNVTRSCGCHYGNIVTTTISSFLPCVVVVVFVDDVVVVVVVDDDDDGDGDDNAPPPS